MNVLNLSRATRGTLRLVASGSPRVALFYRSKKSEVWWRCRELNPGPTCRYRVRTGVSVSILSRHEETNKVDERGLALNVSTDHAKSVPTSLMTPHPRSEDRRSDVSALRRT